MAIKGLGQFERFKMFAYLVLLHDPAPHPFYVSKSQKISFIPHYWWSFWKNLDCTLVRAGKCLSRLTLLICSMAHNLTKFFG